MCRFSVSFSYFPFCLAVGGVGEGEVGYNVERGLCVPAFINVRFQLCWDCFFFSVSIYLFARAERIGPVCDVLLLHFPVPNGYSYWYVFPANVCKLQNTLLCM